MEHIKIKKYFSRKSFYIFFGILFLFFLTAEYIINTYPYANAEKCMEYTSLELTSKLELMQNLLIQERDINSTNSFSSKNSINGINSALYKDGTLLQISSPTAPFALPKTIEYDKPSYYILNNILYYGIFIKDKKEDVQFIYFILDAAFFSTFEKKNLYIVISDPNSEIHYSSKINNKNIEILKIPKGKMTFLQNIDNKSYIFYKIALENSSIKVGTIFLIKEDGVLSNVVICNVVLVLLFLFMLLNLFFILFRNYNTLINIINSVHFQNEFLLKISEKDDINSILLIAYTELSKISPLHEINFITLVKGDSHAKILRVDNKGNITEEEKDATLSSVNFNTEMKSGEVLHVEKDNLAVMVLFFSSDFIKSGILQISYEYDVQSALMQREKFEKLSKLLVPSLKSAKFCETSITDNLTGAMNRTIMKFHLETLIKNSNRYDNAFSILLIDIDFFKKINDNHGHVIGDTVLKATSSVISNTIREVDSFYRYGGEEFLVVLPETTILSAAYVADRIRKNIENLSILKKGTKDEKLKVTISVGVAEYIKHRYENYLKLLEHCDGKLYEAKNSGRNNVKF